LIKRPKFFFDGVKLVWEKVFVIVNMEKYYIILYKQVIIPLIKKTVFRANFSDEGKKLLKRIPF